MYDILKNILNAANENELTQTVTLIILCLFGLTWLFEVCRVLITRNKPNNVVKRFFLLAVKISKDKNLSEEESTCREQYFSKLKSQDRKILLTNYPPEIVNQPGPSQFRFITGILTTIGVIGTFLGIVVGLAGVKNKLNSNSAEMFEGVKSLLGGMDVAFVTSLVGLITSVLLIFTFKVTERYLRKNHERTLSNFNSRFRLETMADYLDKLAGGDQDQVIEKQLAAAEKSAQASEALLTMGTSLERAAENFDADKIGQHLSSSLDKIFTTEMVPVFTEISAELKSLREIKQDNGEKIIQAIMTQLRSEVIEPLSVQIADTSSLVKESTSAVTKLHDELGDIATKLAGAVTTIQSFQEETLTQLSKFSQDLQGILASFQTDTKTILEGVADQLDTAVSQSVDAMNEQKVAFKDSANEAATTFSGIKDQLESALVSQAKIQKEMLDQTSERVNRILVESQKSHEEQVGVIKQVGDTATQLMDNARENLGHTLSNVDQVLIDTKDTVTKELDNFRVTYQQSLTTFFEEQNNLLESTLGEQRDGLAAVVKDCDTVFKEEYTRRKELSEDLGSNMTEMHTAIETVSRLVQAMQMVDSAHFNQIEQTAKSIGMQVGKLDKSYAASSELFSELLKQVPTELNTYFERANQSHETFFSQMDDASAQIHTRLLQVAEYLLSSETQRRMMNEEEVA